MTAPALRAHLSLDRFKWVAVTTLAGLLVGILLSAKLWLSSRWFPLTPLLPVFGPFPPPFDKIIFFAVVGLLVLTGLFRQPWMFLASAVSLVLLALQDQSRWQPWFYQYLLMLSAFGLAGPKKPDAALNSCRLIVAATYFWSGFAKFNPNFMHVTFPWLLEPFIGTSLAHRSGAIQYLALAAPLIECAIGLGLLTIRFRAAAFFAAITMHVLILIAIGPLGREVNSVIWPWNIAMLAFLVLLYPPGAAHSAREILWGDTFGFQRFVLLIFGVAPVLSVFNIWDQYLSSSLYSGNGTLGVIYISDAVFNQLPETIEDYVYEEGPNLNRLSIDSWSRGELNVPPYPETRIYKRVAQTICAYTRDSIDVKLVVKTKLALVNSNREFAYSCAALARAAPPK
jgi:hypothetical protein